MTISHLYYGFRYVSALASIKAQRQLQCNKINEININSANADKLLSIGTAYGDELACFADYGALNGWSKIVGIDLVGEVEEYLMRQPALATYKDKLSFYNIDLQQLPQPFGENYWNCIQCGFVLEDIEYHNKQAVYNNLYRSIVNGGFLIVSEMFIDNNSAKRNDAIRKESVKKLYDFFIEEAKDSLNRHAITNSEFEMLCGNGQEPGLLNTKQMAMDGLRDYFEDYKQTEAHLLEAGFTKLTFHSNPIYPDLGVIIAQKG